MKRLFLLFCALPLLAGCSSPSSSNAAPSPNQPVPAASVAAPAAAPTPLQPAAPASPASPSSDPRIVTTPEFDAVARILNVSVSPGFSGFLKAQFQVQNLSQAPISVAYQFQWTDRAGAPIALAGEPMPPIFLRAGETVPVEAVSPAPLATDFRAYFFLVKH